ncbi:glycerate kinase [Sporolactobacillus vineae]|uniref:glycerate kinase n=1 Tax=Sporolactobacillus vineae TaxID=444463 RepID=UPI00028818D9|nr:glycerate kinase [Sporolactobacillus vineae]
MKIVIAPDSFKESMTALEAAKAVKAGMARVWPEADYLLVPMADGGEGTVQSLIDATDGKRIEVAVTGPAGKPVPGFFGMLGGGKTAVIEMAAAAGLEYLTPSERRPPETTTYGVGQLILAALDRGARHILLGLGGSATNDGGAGMAEALGARLLDAAGKPVGPGGAALSRLASIDMTGFDPRIAETRFEIASDVTNPLTGVSGASAVFGPQKGASPEDVRLLDQALDHYAAVIEKDLHTSVKDVPGAGAAGGLGAGALCFLKGVIRPGVDLVIRQTQLDRKIAGAALVITGEGRIDSQTIFGKTPIGVARTAKRAQIPVIALAGSIGAGYEAVFRHGIDAVFPIVPGVTSLDEALHSGAANLSCTAENVARIWKLAMNCRP